LSSSHKEAQKAQGRMNGRPLKLLENPFVLYVPFCGFTFFVAKEKRPSENLFQRDRLFEEPTYLA
jgi:hypothetical protein